MKNRIAVLTQYYKPEMGAPQNRLYEMAVGLQKKGWEITIISAMPNYPTGRIFPEYKNRFCITEIIDDMIVKRYWIYASKSKKAIPRIISLLSFSFTSLFSLKYLKKYAPEILIVESPPLTLGLTGVFLSRFLKCKLVFNVSDLWPLTAKELGAISDGVFYRFLESIERYIYKKSTMCMGQSEEIVNYISKNSTKKNYLFRNGVDPSRFNNLANTTNALKKITYTGLLGVAQGILDICKNVNFCKLGVEFHIYGDGAEKEDIVEYLNANTGRGIYFHGIVKRENIPSILLDSDATLISLVKNIYGAVPSKIYESMAAGLPILFVGEGEGKMIIEKYDLGLISTPGNYDLLKENIFKLKNENLSYIKKRENCLNAAENIFNRPMQIDSLHNELKNLD